MLEYLESQLRAAQMEAARAANAAATALPPNQEAPDKSHSRLRELHATNAQLEVASNDTHNTSTALGFVCSLVGQERALAVDSHSCKERDTVPTKTCTCGVVLSVKDFGAGGECAAAGTGAGAVGRTAGRAGGAGSCERAAGTAGG